MKTHSRIFRPRFPSLASIFCALALAACGGATAPTSGPATSAAAVASPSPATLLQQYVAAQDRGDAAAMAALFADDATFVGGAQCTASAPCVGRSTILQRTQQAVSAHQHNTIVGMLESSASTVKTRQEVRNDGITKLGLERVLVDVTAQVRDGKIVQWIAVNDQSDAETARYLAAQASPSAAAAALASDPVSIALRREQALNRGDAEGATGAFTENGVLVGNGPCAPTTPCTTRAAIHKRSEVSVANHVRLEPMGDPQVVGNQVQVRAQITNDSLRPAGIDRLIALDTYILQGDKIAARLELLDLSDPQTAKYVLLQQSSASPTAAAKSDAGAVASRWADILNRGDAAAVAELFTPDAVFIGSAPCTLRAPCKGTEAIAARVKDAVATHQQQTPIGSPVVAGNLAQLRWESRSDAQKASGVERCVAIGQAVVKGDKIAAWVAQQDYSDSQTIKFQLFQQAQQASAKPAAAAPN